MRSFSRGIIITGVVVGGATLVLSGTAMANPAMDDPGELPRFGTYLSDPSRIEAVPSMGLNDLQEHWCLKCFVNDWDPDPITGLYDLFWSGGRCQAGSPYQSAPGEFGPGDGWGCAHCLNEGETCFSLSNQYAWDGPCDVHCCPVEGDPYANCDDMFALSMTDAKQVVAMFMERPQALRYDSQRQVVQVLSCNGSVIRQAKPGAAVRVALSEYLAELPQRGLKVGAD